MKLYDNASFLYLFFYLLALFWSAPEVLRHADPFLAGTQSGDMYSFAIVLQEILYRCPPFHANGDPGMVPKG